MTNLRTQALRQRLVSLNLDAFVVRQAEETPTVNLTYLSGFTGSAGLLIVGGEHQFIATDSRYWEQSRHQSPDFTLLPYKRHTEQTTVLAGALKQMAAARVGFEAKRLTVAALRDWQEQVPGVNFVPTDDVVETLRAVKDEAELALIRRATALTDRAYEFVLGRIEPGMSEKEIAWELESFMRTHGADGMAFDVHVASGPGTAEPHHAPGDRQVQLSEPLWIDMGARVGGYCADLTRSFVLGDADATYRKIYGIVLQAQQAALGAVRAGVAGSEVDAAARRVIDAAGYGENFGHGLGHGFGLEIHEKPSAGRTSTDTLPAGSLVTIEPGIYIPGWGGVRIEDVVLVTEDGAQNLTGASKWQA